MTEEADAGSDECVDVAVAVMFADSNADTADNAAGEHADPLLPRIDDQDCDENGVPSTAPTTAMPQPDATQAPWQSGVNASTMTTCVH